MAFNMDPKKCPMPTQDPNVRMQIIKFLPYSCYISAVKFPYTHCCRILKPPP